MKTGLTAAEKTAVRILAGCAAGATEASLKACGVKPATLERLMHAGIVRSWLRELAKPKISVRWYALAERDAPVR